MKDSLNNAGTMTEERAEDKLGRKNDSGEEKPYEYVIKNDFDHKWNNDPYLVVL